MLNLVLDQSLATPLYRQIAEQVRQLIASGELKPGERLPSSRQLAQHLHINPNTVVKAYSELEQERVLATRRGGGTIVITKNDDPHLLQLREMRLAALIGNVLIDSLSQGYSLEELDVAFHLQLARWREEHRKAENAEPAGSRNQHNTIRISGSHDMALDVLASQLRRSDEGVVLELRPTGSMGGLIALREGRADMAGIHLLDADTGEYNLGYIRHVFPGQEMAVVHLAYRVQGLMGSPGNPKSIRGMEDLRRPDVTMCNRQEGSGTRVLLDFALRRLGIKPEQVKGYDNVKDTHLAVALAIARDEADVGLGIQAAARSAGLYFIPLFRERYDLVAFAHAYRPGLLSPVIDAISSEEFKNTIDQMGGYDTSQTGTVTLN